MGLEHWHHQPSVFFTAAVSPGRHPSLPRQGKSQMTDMSFPKCHVFILPFMVSLTQSHIVSHVFRSDQVCWFVQVCSILFRPQLPHILKAMSKAAGKGSVPPPPPSGMITMEAESIPSKSLERKGDWRSWTILNNMTLVKRKHKSSWIILFSLHFSVIAVRFVAVCCCLLISATPSAWRLWKVCGQSIWESRWQRIPRQIERLVHLISLHFPELSQHQLLQLQGFCVLLTLFNAVRVRFCSSCASFHLSSCWWCYCCASAQNTCCLQSLVPCRTLPDSI